MEFQSRVGNNASNLKITLESLLGKQIYVPVESFLSSTLTDAVEHNGITLFYVTCMKSVKIHAWHNKICDN